MPIIEDVILEKVILSELDIPHAFLELHGNLEPNIRENVMGKWDSLKRWFVDTQGRECESRKVLKITNDVIRSIIQNAAFFVLEEDDCYGKVHPRDAMLPEIVLLVCAYIQEMLREGKLLKQEQERIAVTK